MKYAVGRSLMWQLMPQRLPESLDDPTQGLPEARIIQLSGVSACYTWGFMTFLLCENSKSSKKILNLLLNPHFLCTVNAEKMSVTPMCYFFLPRTYIIAF